MDARSLHNLPEQPNVLLGREQELKAARELLLDGNVRVLTLTGPPGVGKTRLAIAAAKTVLEAFPGGIWFVDLAPLRDPVLVASQIASTLGIAERRDGTALDSLALYLHDRQTLLFLDNFEGVVQAATSIGQLVERTTGLKILTTSRERLRLRWERTIVVPPLSLPDPSAPSDQSVLARTPSVAFFVQRATAVDAGFTLSSENASVIAALCNRLDGLPLAIELAAARADVLSPAQILAHMDDRFRLLGMGAPDLPERHQTLKAAIDWSYESLPSAEAQFLRRLAVFSGGFSLTAAEIIGQCQILNLDGLTGLTALVEKSLVIKTQDLGGEARFTLLESIREYLLEKLHTSGERDSARRRHAEYYVGLVEQNYAETKNRNQKARFDVLEAEHDNLRAALQWSLDTGEHSLGGRVAAALWSFWWLRGHIREGIQWLDIFLASPRGSSDETHVRLLEGAGTLRGWQGDFETGRAILIQALRMAEERQDRIAIATILYGLGLIFWVNGRTEEAAWLADKVEGCKTYADPWDLALALLSLGNLLYEAGSDEAAAKAFTESRDYFQFDKERHVAIIAGSKLALLDFEQGDYQQALHKMVESLRAALQSADLYVIALCADDAAQVVAQRMAQQNVAQASELEELARVGGAVDHWREVLGLLRPPREKSAYLQMMQNLQHQLGEQSFMRAWKEGRSIPIERVIQDATQLLEMSNRPVSSTPKVPDRKEASIALSERERQVIGYVAEGLSNQEIAERLFITERTVRFHLTSIFNKLGANNRAQAVSIADRRGLL